MNGKQQPLPARTGATGARAAAELAEIQQRQRQVIKAALVPAWYWWVMTAALVAIGAARDSHDRIVLATAIPLAVLVMVGLTIAMNSVLRHRVRVHPGTVPPAAVLGLIGLILVEAAVTIAVCVILVGHRVPHPLTIGYAAGGAVLVIAGPLLIRYLGRCMLSRAMQPMPDSPTRYGGVFGGPDGGTP
jgi:hypothetical protein